MSGERTPDVTPASRHGSSDDDISLREHMQRQIEDQRRYFERIVHDMRDLLNERFMAQQNAVDELKTTTTQRFESVNEFRAQLNTQASTFMGREESISRHERTTEMIAAMAHRQENETRLLRERFESEVKQLRDRHETDMHTVNSRLDLGQGRTTGLDKAWGLLLGMATLISIAVGVIVATR